ncbi:MAG TPA: DUF763 domain-containing protein [Phycisphaerae bacterium]|nr:DUF763 domain-containing protein [Phycisphaerae bacterium]HOM51138.1 DUF763 domain-containing protein [Phycisphaerae bacterium]HON65258.1 DUF763 domain-containing protein [Phycisphaerae bacterium]HPP25266.1 DUF763 domain-containing protein [Phycisphaerae bacterium]
MQRRTAHLPLHGGKAPSWLFERMHRMAGSIVQLIVEDAGPGEMLNRLADPLWFQAFGCVLGFDWHSSGLTTVTCGAVAEAYRRLGPDLGIHAAGGKGGASRKTPEQVARIADRRGLEGDKLIYASRMSAKVDSAAVQDGYQIYTHHFFFSDDNNWCVVQQGMNDANGYARRYHWLGSTLDSFVCEPHSGVMSPEAKTDRRGDAETRRGGGKDGAAAADLFTSVTEPRAEKSADLLNMVAAEAERSRERSTELARVQPERLLREISAGPSLFMPRHHPVLPKDINPVRLGRVLRLAYERQPGDFEALLGTPGVGPSTIRSLALIAELVYGEPACRRDITKRWTPADPPTFSYAHGGKDGFPFPVDRTTYDRSISLLESAVRRARIDPQGKDQALFRLSGWLAGTRK